MGDKNEIRWTRLAKREQAKDEPTEIRVKFSLSIGDGAIVRSDTFEFDRKEWESWTEDDRKRELIDWIQAYVDVHYEVE